MLELLLKTVEAHNNTGIIGKQNKVFSLMSLHSHVMLYVVDMVAG